MEGPQTKGDTGENHPRHTDVAVEGKTSPGGRISVGGSCPATQEKTRIGLAEAMQHVVKRRGACWSARDLVSSYWLQRPTRL